MYFVKKAEPGRAVRAALTVTAIVLAPALVAGCMSKDDDLNLATYVEQTDPADALYNQGLANLNAGRLKEASRKFDAVDRQHPYSEYARKSMVMSAFTNYRQGNYEEAINAGKRYVQLYPSSEDAAYAQYIVGLSYFRQIRDVTQDQKESRRAIEAMEEVIQRWPESQYVEDARTKVRFARDQLMLPERLLMYSLVRGLRPMRCLEIGTHFGGSTTITCAALDDVGAGSLVCVDPNPLVPADVWARLSHRATMLRGCSPDILAEAVAVAGGLFDFVFIDGDHTHAGVVRDVDGVLGVAAAGAHLLFHDSHYWEVRDAIDECVAKYPGRLLDAGTLSALSTDPITAPDGSQARWGGFRLLRVATTPVN